MHILVYFFCTFSTQLSKKLFPCSLLYAVRISQFPLDAKAILRKVRLKASPQGHKFHVVIQEDRAYMKHKEGEEIHC